MRLTDLFTVLMLALAIAPVSMTITKTKVAAPFRDWVSGKSEWFGNLFSCPYCLSHWLAFGAIAIYRPRVVELFYLLDLLVTSFVCICIATVFVWAIMVTLLNLGRREY